MVEEISRKGAKIRKERKGSLICNQSWKCCSELLRALQSLREIISNLIFQFLFWLRWFKPA